MVGCCFFILSKTLSVYVGPEIVRFELSIALLADLRVKGIRDVLKVANVGSVLSL